MSTVFSFLSFSLIPSTEFNNMNSSLVAVPRGCMTEWHSQVYCLFFFLFILCWIDLFAADVTNLLDKDSYLQYSLILCIAFWQKNFSECWTLYRGTFSISNFYLPTQKLFLCDLPPPYNCIYLWLSIYLSVCLQALQGGSSASKP